MRSRRLLPPMGVKITASGPKLPIIRQSGMSRRTVWNFEGVVMPYTATGTLRPRRKIVRPMKDVVVNL